MKKSIIYLILIIYSCTKNDTIQVKEKIYQRLNLSGNLNIIVGKWQIEAVDYFHFHPSNCTVNNSSYTESMQNYFIEISQNGEFKLFKNDSLIEMVFFTDTDFVNFTSTSSVIQLQYNFFDNTDISFNFYTDTNQCLVSMPFLAFNDYNIYKLTGLFRFKRV